MSHPLVYQLHFTRAEFLRGLVGLQEAEASKRFAAMNCIQMLGHQGLTEFVGDLDGEAPYQPE